MGGIRSARSRRRRDIPLIDPVADLRDNSGHALSFNMQTPRACTEETPSCRGFARAPRGVWIVRDVEHDRRLAGNTETVPAAARQQSVSHCLLRHRQVRRQCFERGECAEAFTADCAAQFRVCQLARRMRGRRRPIAADRPDS